MPFFILHGEADTVTDPEVSRALYERSSSIDKTMKMYPGMWHGLTSGEPNYNIEIVFLDILSWLDKRSGDGATRTIKLSQSLSSDSEDLTKTTSLAIENGQNQRGTRSSTKNLGGWKGRGLHHHSAM